MTEEFGYEKLEVWQLSVALTTRVYAITRGFPQTELFGLAGQMRRAAVSVPSNISEGYGRGSKASFAACTRVSRGSLYELRTQTEVAFREKYIGEAENAELRQEMILLSRKLDAFLRSLESAPAQPLTANS
jgi:four helix bundle protein